MMNDEDTSSGCSPEFPVVKTDFLLPILPDPITFSIDNPASLLYERGFGLAPVRAPSQAENFLCLCCLKPYDEPKVLVCFHTFCKECLVQNCCYDAVFCPKCNMEAKLTPSFGLDGLLTDFGMERLVAQKLSMNGADVTQHIKSRVEADKGLIFGSPSSGSSSPPLTDSPLVEQVVETSGAGEFVKVPCTGCKTGERASHFCQECGYLLCQNCTMAHQYMHCFSGHKVKPIFTSNNASPPVSTSPITAGALEQSRSAPKCMTHQQLILYFCLDCHRPMCGDCSFSTHKDHKYEEVEKVAEKESEHLERLLNAALEKNSSLSAYYSYLDSANQRLINSVQSTQKALNDNVAMLIDMVEEQRKRFMKEIECAYTAKQVQLRNLDKSIQEMSERITSTTDFTKRLLAFATPAEVVVFKQILETRFNLFLAYTPDLGMIDPVEIELERPNSLLLSKQHIGTLLGRLHCGASEWQQPASSQPGMPPTPIGRPPSRPAGNLINDPSAIGGNNPNFLPIGTPSVAAIIGGQHQGLPSLLGSSAPTNGYTSALESSIPIRNASLGCLNDQFCGSLQSSEPFNGEAQYYEKWSSALEPSLGLLESGDCEVEKAPVNGAYAATASSRSQVKRFKMIYHCKFGEFGVMEGQFTEPSGVAVNAQNDIIVADTNNHRIQVFDKEGRFKFQFGECGKRDGQLLYPNRVAVNKMTGDFVVTERSPTHQIQVYNQYGQFLRKFGANILQHPRGVCVDNKGRVVVVECKVMRVIIFDMFGNILQKFSCSRYLEFPNGVCTNDKNEILISDNRAHCVKVFSYEGTFLRQIGGEGVTNYPIGVGITSTGDVVVADNHNNFNLTLFAPDGQLIGALESKVKHAQCFDVALVDDGSVVLASKDYRLYLYRFNQFSSTPPQ
ncbi:unnamed protein product, partial [Mesorhabditis belari]|uniref:Brain tumor protein n=1 Tax=Mesorhabditis belari TaxID=2138241 RepID=A0AAF3E830_9BILA